MQDPFLILSFPGSFDSHQAEIFHAVYLPQIDFFWQSSVIPAKEATALAKIILQLLQLRNVCMSVFWLEG